MNASLANERIRLQESDHYSSSNAQWEQPGPFFKDLGHISDTFRWSHIAGFCLVLEFSHSLSRVFISIWPDIGQNLVRI